MDSATDPSKYRILPRSFGSIEREVYNHEYEDVKWKPWQQQILDILTEPPKRDQPIYWIYEPIGYSGKSFLTLYIYLTFKNVIHGPVSVNGLKKQIKRIHNRRYHPHCIVFDICCSEYNHTDYNLLERCRDGHIGCDNTAIFMPVHIVCFSHQKPNPNQIRKYKYKVFQIKNESLVEDN